MVSAGYASVYMQARHEKICAKNTTKRRPVFESSKQRILGTDIQKYIESLPPSKRGRPSTSEQVHSYNYLL